MLKMIVELLLRASNALLPYVPLMVFLGLIIALFALLFECFKQWQHNRTQREQKLS